MHQCYVIIIFLECHVWRVHKYWVKSLIHNAKHNGDKISYYRQEFTIGIINMKIISDREEINIPNQKPYGN